MSQQVKETLLGILIGLLGNLVGFFIFGYILSLLQGVSFSYFYHNMFLGTDLFRSQIITGTLLVNILIFYFFMRKRLDSYARGIMVIILLTVIAIVYYFT